MMSTAPQARSAGLRYVFPVLAGKLARFATRLRGGGSAFPGYLTNRLAPSLLPTLADQFRYGVVFVLGSNGKTTTTHMVSEVLRAHGLRVFTNPTSANLPQGVTSALLADATLTGRIKADVAVLEIDEGYAADLADRLSPSVILSLNVQVDQLYRFYETERVADMMLDASTRASAHVVVNRDDPYLSKIDVAKRIVLIRPTDRHELPALKAAGFNGYLVKPVRAASLAARLAASNAYEQAVADATDEAVAAANGAGTGADKGLSILVAEDNDINALLARALLTRLGHRPTIASDGAAAVESWQAARAAGAPYDLVLMDVQMPVMDGLEAVRRIRAAESEPELGEKPTPVLALTANASGDDRDAVLASGMDGLLVKPLDRERLREVLETIHRASAPLAA